VPDVLAQTTLNGAARALPGDDEPKVAIRHYAPVVAYARSCGLYGMLWSSHMRLLVCSSYPRQVVCDKPLGWFRRKRRPVWVMTAYEYEILAHTPGKPPYYYIYMIYDHVFIIIILLTRDMFFYDGDQLHDQKKIIFIILL
jgi:hypothetical protein